MASDSLRFLGLDPSSPVDCTCDLLNKVLSTRNYVEYMLDRTIRMFRYKNLPDTIPAPMLEAMLQTYGSVIITEVDGSLYAFRGNFGGPPDPYYRPTQCVVANPALGYSKTIRIINHLPPFNRSLWDEMPDGIRFLNDTQIRGLIPLFSRYASQMTENDISIRSAQINTRQQVVISASDGPEIESARVYVQGLEEGKTHVISRRNFLDGVDIKDVSRAGGDTIIQLIELQQYLKASWYNEIGLNSNFNMKRQYMSADEIQSSSDIMLPLVDNMFECRLQAIEAINNHFGTNIEVDKDSAWAHKQLMSDMSLMVESPDGSGMVPMSPVDETEILESENAEKDIQEEQDDSENVVDSSDDSENDSSQQDSDNEEEEDDDKS